MEPDLVPYSPILHRPPLRWPGDARVALWVVPNIEHYEYLPAFVRTRDPWPRSPHPDVLGYSQRDYGNRVGLWRLFELTDALGMRCTVSLSMAVLQHFPEILGAMEHRGWEYMSHGIYNTRYHWGFSPEEERASMEESKDLHQRLTGRGLRGWFSPAITNTLNTFDLAAAAGRSGVGGCPSTPPSPRTLPAARNPSGSACCRCRATSVPTCVFPCPPGSPENAG